MLRLTITKNKQVFSLDPAGTDVIVVKVHDADVIENYGFDLKIVSVTPRQQDMEFYLNHISDTQTATISFKGCLDYEVGGLNV